VRERLLASATPVARARVLEQALLDASDGTLEQHPAVAFALNEFHAAPEARKIGAVGDAAGLSARRFIEVFRKEVGLTPKLFCRVRRFQRVLRMISVGRWTGRILRRRADTSIELTSFTTSGRFPE
jgi:methylphosphotriester-DNA--protein-cysteine methyltransferase